MVQGAGRIVTALNRPEATWTVALEIYPRLLAGFGMLLFTKSSLMEFQVMYLTLFYLFSVINRFMWFCMQSFHKNIQSMIEFLKVPLFILPFSYYTLITFLTVLFVILLSMLMILLSTISMSRHLICVKNLKVASELEFYVQDTVYWGRKWLVVCNFLIGITLVDVHLNWLNWFLFYTLLMGLLVIAIVCMIFLSSFLGVLRKGFIFWSKCFLVQN